MVYKHFSQYRPSDYRTARSMKELYGWDAPLYVEEPESVVWRWICWAAIGGVVLALLALPLVRIILA